MYAARIDSQHSKATSVDWSHSQFKDMYQQVEFETELEHQVWPMQDELGLVFGAYDFVVPLKSAPVFLEVNPGGQWLWQEHRTGIPVSQNLANLLLA